MKLGTYFRQAIEGADWQKVCKVFTQITGEHIDPPEVAFADMEMPDDEQPSSPADIEMGEYEQAEPGNSDDEDGPTKPVVQVEEASQQAEPPTSPRRVSVEDFRVHRDTTVQDSDGNVRDKAARKVSMSIPTNRKNRFNDKQTIAMKDSVKANPKLGVQNPVPRGMRGLLDGLDEDSHLADAKDTGKRVDVVCSLCGKEETVSETLAVGWFKDPPGTKDDDKQNTYKCNECSTSSGRAKLLRKKRNM